MSSVPPALRASAALRAAPVRLSSGLSSAPLSAPVSAAHERLRQDHLANMARLKAAREARAMADPEACYAAFPDRWRAYLHSNFRTARHVAQAFFVSEKAAQKWWDGIGGPTGGKVAFAVARDPGAAQFLFAAE